MVEIPQPVVTQEDLNQWYEAKELLKKYKTLEYALRKKIFGVYFPAPEEGTNTVPFNEDYDLKAKHTLDRKVDEPVLNAVAKELREEHKLPVDTLIRYKPELNKREYNKLTAEEKRVFDQVLTIKEGSPQIEFVLNKNGKAKQAAAQEGNQ